MKKIISVVLSVLTIFSLFSGITIFSAADGQENGENYVTNINFDAEFHGNYKYFGAEQDQSSFPVFVDTKDKIHDNVYALYYTNSTNANDHRGYLLRDSKSKDNAPLRLEYNKSYRINLDYKAIKTANGNRNISVWWVKEPKANTSYTDVRYNFNNNGTVIQTYTQGYKSNDWEKATAVITPPDSEYVYPVLVVNTYNQQNIRTDKIYFDNITVQEYTYKASTQIDFDYEKQNGYKYYRNADNNTSFCDFNGNNAFGVYVYRNNGSPHRTYAIREAETGYPMPFEVGFDYKIILKYLNKKSSCDYQISVAWVSNPSITAIDGLPVNADWLGTDGDYNPINSCPYIQDLAIVRGNNAGVASEWHTVTAVITPYSKEKMYPVLFVHPVDSNVTVTGQEIYFDDISVTKQTSQTVMPAKFDYNAQQVQFYKTLSTKNNVTVDSGGAATFNAVNCISDNLKDIGALAISATDGNNFAKYKAGTKLCVAAKVNASGKKLSVGIAYTDIDVNKNSIETEGTLDTLSKAGKLLKVADIEAGDSGDTDVYGEITVPEHFSYENMYFVVYSEDSKELTANVSVKDITVGNADMNFDGKTDICDLVSLNESDKDNYNCNYDINADGYINENDLNSLKKLLLK